MRTMVAQRDDTTLLKASEVAMAHKQFIHLLLDNFGDLFQIIKFVLVSNWISPLKYAHSIDKALKIILGKKANWIAIWSKIRTKTLEILLSDPERVAKHCKAVKLVVQNLKSITEFMTIVMAPLLNDSSTSDAKFYQLLALAFQVNSKRINARREVAMWNSVEFTHDFKYATCNEDACAEVLGTLDEKTKAVFGGVYGTVQNGNNTNNSASKSSTNKIDLLDKSENGSEKKKMCWFCEGNHLKRNCPKWLKKQIKAQSQSGNGGYNGGNRGRKRKYANFNRNNYNNSGQFYGNSGQQYSGNNSGGFGQYYSGNNNGSFGQQNKRFRNNNYQNYAAPNGYDRNRAAQGAPNQNGQPQMASEHKYAQSNGQWVVKNNEKGGALCDYWAGRKGPGAPCRFRNDFMRCKWLHACSICWIANQHKSEDCPNVAQQRGY